MRIRELAVTILTNSAIFTRFEENISLCPSFPAVSAGISLCPTFSKLRNQLALRVQLYGDVREKQTMSCEEMIATLSVQLKALPAGGLCAACEQRISPKRLAALPWAKYCIACQEVREGIAAESRWENAA